MTDDESMRFVAQIFIGACILGVIAIAVSVFQFIRNRRRQSDQEKTADKDRDKRIAWGCLVFIGSVIAVSFDGEAARRWLDFLF